MAGASSVRATIEPSGDSRAARIAAALVGLTGWIGLGVQLEASIALAGSAGAALLDLFNGRRKQRLGGVDHAIWNCAKIASRERQVWEVSGAQITNRNSLGFVAPPLRRISIFAA